ncbi:hypothetical protein QBZ16_005501 [Prototheca wickerhamii]|uniref:Major facilitator superfamily (MFS) profile domain-containing protein n=1 Tax=Prototheca wickerhamii TaxID=3111 RepID=A0AAD9MMD6_PROWI|nr:hypothetical protein QBZ16_005501 [Prototheca wickerhamii]
MGSLHVAGPDESVLRGTETVGELRVPFASQRWSLALTWRGLTVLVSASSFVFATHQALLAVAIIPLASLRGWDQASQGILLSAYFCGQLCSQLAGGWLADRWGGRGPLAAGVLASSVASVLTPVAAAGGRGGLIVIRSSAVAAVTGATLFGTAAVFLLVPPLLARTPWQLAFYLAGGPAAAWLLPWAALSLQGTAAPPGGPRPVHFTLRALWRTVARPCAAPRRPRARARWRRSWRRRRTRSAGARRAWPRGCGPRAGRRPRPRPARRAPPSDDGASDAGTEWSDGVATGYKARLADAPRGPAALMARREVWAICVAQFAGSWGAYALLSWMPTFFRDRYGVELARLGEFAVLPYLAQGLVGLGAGWVADRLLTRGHAVVRVRRGLQAAGMAWPALCLLAAAACRGPGAAAFWITAGAAAAGLTLAGAGANHLDATGSWGPLFGLAALMYALGAVVYWFWAGGEALLADGAYSALASH